VLDAVTVGDLLKQSADRFENLSSLEIDLAQVSEADSAGLALLIEWVRVAKDAKQQLAFHNVPGQIGALARISEVEDLVFASNGSAPAQAIATG
jgi:phospholipid transport system transporter-binding protein